MLNAHLVINKMRIKLGDLSRVLHDEFIPFSSILSSRGARRHFADGDLSADKKLSLKDEKVQFKENAPINQSKDSVQFDPEYRENEMHIQMLSKSLFDQIFGKLPKGIASDDARR